MARSACAACGATFSSLSGFDMHRTGTFARFSDRTRVPRPASRRCLSPAAMLAAGLVQKQRAGKAEKRSIWVMEGSVQRWGTARGILAGTHDEVAALLTVPDTRTFHHVQAYTGKAS